MKKLAFLLLAVATGALAQQQRGPSPQILIPAAGSVASANGTFFHSDIAIYNYRNDSQVILLQWLPRGITGLNTTTAIQIRLNPLSGILSEDFVTDIMRQSGLGAILVTALTTEGGTLDINGRLAVTDRIWTPQP